MKICSRTNHPPDLTPAFVSNLTRAYNQAEAIDAINNLWLALEEAKSIDEHRISQASDKLASLCNLLTHCPHDHVAIVMTWRSFRLPVMVDGLCGAHERAIEAMGSLLDR